MVKESFKHAGLQFHFCLPQRFWARKMSETKIAKWRRASLATTLFGTAKKTGLHVANRLPQLQQKRAKIKVNFA